MFTKENFSIEKITAIEQELKQRHVFALTTRHFDEGAAQTDCECHHWKSRTHAILEMVHDCEYVCYVQTRGVQIDHLVLTPVPRTSERIGRRNPLKMHFF
jgi:hypothetical protein